MQNQQQSFNPTIKWAQRKDRTFIEIALRDIHEEKIQLKQNQVTFEGKSGNKKYSFSFQLFEEIETDESKWIKTGFHLTIVLTKKDKNRAFWPRLTKSSQKKQYIQIDWAKWVDEDEEDQEGDKGLGGFDPSQMQGFPGMGGANQTPDEDDEDEQEEQENLNDLQKQEQIQQK